MQFFICKNLIPQFKTIDLRHVYIRKDQEGLLISYIYEFKRFIAIHEKAYLVVIAKFNEYLRQYLLVVGIIFNYYYWPTLIHMV